jgi:hypothetical protein
MILLRRDRAPCTSYTAHRTPGTRARAPDSPAKSSRTSLAASTFAGELRSGTSADNSEMTEMSCEGWPRCQWRRIETPSLDELARSLARSHSRRSQQCARATSVLRRPRIPTRPLRAGAEVVLTEHGDDAHRIAERTPLVRVTHKDRHADFPLPASLVVDYSRQPRPLVVP